MFARMHAQYEKVRKMIRYYESIGVKLCVTECNQPSKVPMEMSGNLAFAFHTLTTITFSCFFQIFW